MLIRRTFQYLTLFLLLPVVVSSLLYGIDKNEVVDKDIATYHKALALQEHEDQEFLKTFIHSHPEYRNERTPHSLIGVFGTALISDSCDKNMYKNLLKEFLRQPGWTLLDEFFAFDPEQLADQNINLEKRADLISSMRCAQAFKEAVIEAWRDIVLQACKAVRESDFEELDRLITYWPTLLSSPSPQLHFTSVLHAAAEVFDSKKPQSVTIFAYLMKKGASFTIKNDLGVTIEELIIPNHPAFECFTYHKNFHKNLKGQPAPITYEVLKKKAVTLRPYWKHILAGMIGIALCYLLVRSDDPIKNENDLRLMRKPLL